MYQAAIQYEPFSGTLGVAPGDGAGDLVYGGSGVFLVNGMGSPDEATAEQSAFDTAADAVQAAYTAGNGIICTAGLLQANNNAPVNYSQGSYPFTGGITQLRAVCAQQCMVAGCQVQLWIVKQYTGNGFTAGQAFEVTAGVGTAYYLYGIDGANANDGSGTILAGDINATANATSSNTGIASIASTAYDGTAILTVNTTGAHGFQPGQLVSLTGFADATKTPTQFAIVLTIGSNTFTASAVTALSSWSTHVDSGSPIATYVGWFPQVGDLIVATLNIPAGSFVRDLVVTTDWTTGYIQGIVSRTAAFAYVIDGGGYTPPTGSAGQIDVPANCTVRGWTITADQVGSAVVDILTAASASGVGSVSSIAGTDKPTLSGARGAADTTLSGWGTRALLTGQQLQFYLDSVTTCTRLNISIGVSIP
jgi:hypothetical protein